MSDLSDKPENVYGATVTIKTRDALGQAAPWMKFLGIVGYVGIVFMAVFGVGFMIFGFAFSGSKPFGSMFPLVGLVYIAIAVALFFPVRFLMRMAKASKQYRASSVAMDLEAVAVNLKKLAKFYGVFMIVVLAIYLVVIVGMIVFAAVFAGHLWQK